MVKTNHENGSGDEYIPSSETSSDNGDSDYTSDVSSESSEDNVLFKPVQKKIKTFHRASSVPPQVPAFTFCLINNTVDEEEAEDDDVEDNFTDDTRKRLIQVKREVDLINNSSNISRLEDRIYLSHHDVNVKAKLISKLSQTVDKGDRNKMVTWVNEVLKLPLGINKPVIKYTENFDFNSFLLVARRKLDDVVYGMENTKEEILDFLVKLLLHPQKKGTVLALKGPRGVGKTKLCRALSDILNLPLFQISMGGLTDSSVLIGHDSTYVGSKCGRIASIVQEAKCMNFILYIDEMDKCGNEGKAKDVQGVLTHLLDETQNTQFQDLYFEGIPLDLSNVLFITSFNHIEDVDPIVLNRMKVLEIQELTTDDKVMIVKKFTLPEINYNNFYLSDEIIRYIITCKSVCEPGMRNINKNIETVINRLNTYFVLSVCDNSKDISKNFSYENLKIKTDNDGKFIITENVIDVLLSKDKVDESWRSMYI